MERLLNVTSVVSVILMALILLSVRRAHIRVEYSVAWLLSAATLFILSRSPKFLEAGGRFIGLPPDSPLALALMGGIVFLFMFFLFSVIISKLRDDNIALAQRVAILEYHLDGLERQEPK